MSPVVHDLNKYRFSKCGRVLGLRVETHGKLCLLYLYLFFFVLILKQCQLSSTSFGSSIVCKENFRQCLCRE